MKPILKLAYDSLRAMYTIIKSLLFGDGKLIILTYHRVLNTNTEEAKLEQPGMYVTPESFERQLRLISKFAEPTTLNAWINRQKQSPSKRQSSTKLKFAVTFDDGWKDNFDNAFPILKKLNIPATIFLVTNMVGSNQDFWPGRLSRLIIALSEQQNQLYLDNSSLLKLLGSNLIKKIANTRQQKIELINSAIEYAKQNSDQENHELISAIYDEFDHELKEQSYTPILNWEQIEEMSSSGLIDFGSHTCNHVRMTKELPVEIQNAEIKSSLSDLKENSLTSVNIFCYPNGDISPSSQEVVSQTYDGACTTKRGINHKDDSHFFLKRFNLHEESSSSGIKFLSRIAW